MDDLYRERAACVGALIKAAESKGWVCCWWIDPEEGLDWPIVCIELPTGQVTWHLAKMDFDQLGLERLEKVDARRWDGHPTSEKYRRLRECDWGEQPVNHPAHYNQGELEADGTAVFEPIKVIEDWMLGRGFTLGNALKYIQRAPFKGSELSDIKKALWYTRRAVDGQYAAPTTALRRYTPEAVVKGWSLSGSLGEAIMLMCDGRISDAADALEAHLRALRGR